MEMKAKQKIKPFVDNDDDDATLSKVENRF